MTSVEFLFVLCPTREHRLFPRNTEVVSNGSVGWLIAISVLFIRISISYIFIETEPLAMASPGIGQGGVYHLGLSSQRTLSS